MCVPARNLSSCWHEKCLHIHGCVRRRRKKKGGTVALPKFANGCLTFFCNETPSVPLFSSLFPSPPPPPSLQCYWGVETCLALINVPGIRLALHLSFALPSLFQLHPVFYPCHPCMHNTSRLQLQLAPVLSWFHTHTHTRARALKHTAEAFRSTSIFRHSSNPSPRAALSIMMDLLDNN